jgi:hypothetical protein
MPLRDYHFDPHQTSDWTLMCIWMRVDPDKTCVYELATKINLGERPKLRDCFHIIGQHASFVRMNHEFTKRHMERLSH